MYIPRNEHPKPQFERANWENLNGEWQFEIDNERSGKERKIYLDDVEFNSKINVPFCPESKLSGLEHKDFMYGVWYKRCFTVSNTDDLIYIHFGAVDYKCEVFVNGASVGVHTGGYVSFKFEISNYIHQGKNTVTVYAEDDTRCNLIPTGKQSQRFASYGCLYTRSTGIWQTVWLEYVPKTHIEKVKFYPNANTCELTVKAELSGTATFTAVASYNGKNVGSIRINSNGGNEIFSIPLSEKHLWEVGKGNLYDLELKYGDDIVKSYFGLRNIRIDGYKFLINEKSVFQRLVLDQGFYPDGIYTAPTADDLKHDIELSLACGFNGARLHQKVFEERFLYYCDKLGYIVWGEYPNWGLDLSNDEAIYSILPEWLDEVDRDFNHPSIVGWCPFNETQLNQKNQLISMTYTATKTADETRPCIDTSGWVHFGKTDVMDRHDYTQNPEEFAKHYINTEDGAFIDDNNCKGIPYFVSEYGGIRWTNDNNGWGYGNAPKSAEEFIERFKALTKCLLDNKYIFALCYTQLTDVEQEQNGLYTYNRVPKFNTELYKEALMQKAAIED